MKFTKIPVDTFKKLVLNAGMLLNAFTPATSEYEETDILAATTGGLTFAATPTFEDFGEDIDNCPKNMMELKRLTGWDVSMSGTALTLDTNSAKSFIAAADIGTTDQTKVTPRNSLKTEDFHDLWLVADYSDENGANGGYIAIHMLNALSTGGFQVKTTDSAKGNFAFTYTGHVSIDAQDVVPFELYIKSGTAA